MKVLKGGSLGQSDDDGDKNGENVFSISIYCEIKISSIHQKGKRGGMIYSKITLFSVPASRRMELPLVEMEEQDLEVCR